MLRAIFFGKISTSEMAKCDITFETIEGKKKSVEKPNR